MRATASSAASPTGEATDEGLGVPAFEARIAALVARIPTADDEALEQQREAFDFVAREQAEIDRETNALRDMAMDQMKFEDELLKKWIELI